MPGITAGVGGAAANTGTKIATHMAVASAQSAIVTMLNGGKIGDVLKNAACSALAAGVVHLPAGSTVSSYYIRAVTQGMIEGFAQALIMNKPIEGILQYTCAGIVKGLVTCQIEGANLDIYTRIASYTAVQGVRCMLEGRNLGQIMEACICSAIGTMITIKCNEMDNQKLNKKLEVDELYELQGQRTYSSRRPKVKAKVKAAPISQDQNSSSVIQETTQEQAQVSEQQARPAQSQSQPQPSSPVQAQSTAPVASAATHDSVVPNAQINHTAANNSGAMESVSEYAIIRRNPLEEHSRRMVAETLGLPFHNREPRQNVHNILSNYERQRFHNGQQQIQKNNDMMIHGAKFGLGFVGGAIVKVWDCTVGIPLNILAMGEEFNAVYNPADFSRVTDYERQRLDDSQQAIIETCQGIKSLAQGIERIVQDNLIIDPNSKYRHFNYALAPLNLAKIAFESGGIIIKGAYNNIYSSIDMYHDNPFMSGYGCGGSMTDIAMMMYGAQSAGRAVVSSAGKTISSVPKLAETMTSMTTGFSLEATKSRIVQFTRGFKNRDFKSILGLNANRPKPIILSASSPYASIQPQVGTPLTWLQAAKNAQAAADASFAPSSIGAAQVWTKKARVKAAQLPTTGKIRFVLDEDYRASNLILRGKRNGYLDKFGNEWVAGPSRTPGELFEWDVQLSPLGRKKLGWASRDGKHLNVSLKGRITHD
jgi:hypothetical protein